MYSGFYFVKIGFSQLQRVMDINIIVPTSIRNGELHTTFLQRQVSISTKISTDKDQQKFGLSLYSVAWHAKAGKLGN